MPMHRRAEPFNRRESHFVSPSLRAPLTARSRAARRSRLRTAPRQPRWPRISAASESGTRPSAAARKPPQPRDASERGDDRQRQNCNRSRGKPIDAGADRDETCQSRVAVVDDADAEADERSPSSPPPMSTAAAHGRARCSRSIHRTAAGAQARRLSSRLPLPRITPGSAMRPISTDRRKHDRRHAEQHGECRAVREPFEQARPVVSR